MENIRVRLAPGIYGRIFTINLECGPDRRHQETRQCRVWRSTARIRDGESIGGKGPDGSDPASLASKSFQCGGIVAGIAPERPSDRNRNGTLVSYLDALLPADRVSISLETATGPTP